MFKELWPRTTNQSTINGRKAEIVSMLKHFEKEAREMLDLEVSLLNEDAKILGIEVKKRKLLLF